MLNITQKGFKYAIIPMNMSCIYIKQNNGHSVVFIVFFSIFTGIFGVVLITFLAYCVIKQCERRRKMHNNSSLVLNPAPGSEIPREVIDQVEAIVSKQPSTNDSENGTDRKIAAALGTVL